MAISLRQYWSPGREDNFLTATAQGERDALDAGYLFVRVEGYAYPSSQFGTIALNQYWHPQRGDNIAVASQQGNQDALNAGYVFVRTEGYVLPVAQGGAVPLKLFWNPGRGDNMSTATAQGEADAIAAGYVFVRNEGYVSAQPASLTIDLDSDLGANHYMTTHGVLLPNGHIDAQTRTRTLTWFGGFTGGVYLLLEDPNGFTIGSTAMHRFGVDGTMIGRSDRSDYWSEDSDPNIAARTAAVHCVHTWAPKFPDETLRRVNNLVGEAVATARPIIDLIAEIKGLGGDGK